MKIKINKVRDETLDVALLLLSEVSAQEDQDDPRVVVDQKVVEGLVKVKVATGVGAAIGVKVATGAVIRGRPVRTKTEWTKSTLSIKFLANALTG
jgi:hypothetical protein